MDEYVRYPKMAVLHKIVACFFELKDWEKAFEYATDEYGDESSVQILV
jgi:hypothetical protein